MTGILIIHGFAGTRAEVMAIYDHLSMMGYAVTLPLLAGHEGSKKELSASTMENWIESAESAYLSLSKTCEKMIVIGFSMGGLIAAQLYQKYQFDKLVTINTPVYYWDMRQIAKNIFSDFPTFSRKYLNASTNKPIRSLFQFQKLLRTTLPLFQSILCDTLVMQAQDDDAVHMKSGDYIYQKVSGKKWMCKMPCGGHMLFTSHASSTALEKIVAFIAY